MGREENTPKQAMLVAAAKAAAGGHDLGDFREGYDSEGVLGGWRALCRRCNDVIWITPEGTSYYLLEDPCAEKARL